MRCIPTDPEKAQSFSQVFKTFENTSTNGATKTMFRSRLRHLCQHGTANQTDKGLFYCSKDYDFDAAKIGHAKMMESHRKEKHKYEQYLQECDAKLAHNPRLPHCEKNLSEARTLIMKALVLIDKASRQL